MGWAWDYFKRRERGEQGWFSGNIEKVVEGIWDQAVCGRAGVLSKGSAEQNCRKLWRETGFQLKWELQRIGDPRPCDTDKHSYRWKAELGNDWIREKLCMPVSEMDGWGSQDLWSLLDCITSLRLQTWNCRFGLGVIVLCLIFFFWNENAFSGSLFVESL